MRAKWIIIPVLILALLGACAGIVAVAWFSLGAFDLPRFDVLRSPAVNASAEVTEEASFPVDGPVTLNVQNDFGSVEVRAADEANSDTIQVTAVKTVYAETEAQAEQALDYVQVIMEQEGNTLQIRIERDRPTLSDTWNGGAVDFTITVPVETTAVVKTQSGQLSLNGTRGEVRLESQFGSIRAIDVEGSLFLQSRSGNVTARRVRAEDDGELSLKSDFGRVVLEDAVAGQVVVSSRSGAISLTDVKAAGPVDLSSDFGGITFKTGQAGSLKAIAGNGEVDLSDLLVSGDLNAENSFGDLHLAGVTAAEYHLTTRNGQVTVDGVRGTLQAASEFGGITISNGEEVTLDVSTRSGSITYRGSLGEGPHRIESGFGDVRLSLPASSAFNFDLETGFGDIESEFEIQISTDPNEKHWVGKANGGGPQLRVYTRSGAITLEKGDS